jgi:hypothetical protein
MIIVHLVGGLGNQMFQYALGRHLAEKQSTILKLDVSGFQTYKLRRYGLHCFHIWEHIATQTEIDSLHRENNRRIKHFVRRVLRKLNSNLANVILPPNPLFFEERYFRFDPVVLQKTAPLYLRGYWQSEKYFSEIQEILRREFEIKYKQDPESRRISDLIQSTNSISLHVRRADYVQDPHINQIYGTCDQSYYDRSIQHLITSVKDPHFFIFSDDPAWVKVGLKLGFPATVVEHNGPFRDYEDLRLMSQCKHNIIANSSFSWWGAWLNENPEKIVIGPQRWFADEERNAQAQDVVPEGWVRL